MRPIDEVMPPKASVKPAWTVKDFGGLDHATPGEAPVMVPGDGAGAARQKAAKERQPVKAVRSAKSASVKAGAAKASSLKRRK